MKLPYIVTAVSGCQKKKLIFNQNIAFEVNNYEEGRLLKEHNVSSTNRLLFL